MFSGGSLGILTLILALVGTIVSLILITPDKARANLNGFLRFLHDLFNFKFLIIEKIMQFLYIFSTLIVIFIGFFALFNEPGMGLLVMLVGPIAVRLAYELYMMLILLIKNVIQINNKLKNQNGTSEKNVFDSQPDLSEYTENKEAE